MGVVGLAVREGGLRALQSSTIDEYKITIPKLLSHFEQTSLYFWRNLRVVLLFKYS